MGLNGAELVVVEVDDPTVVVLVLVGSASVVVEVVDDVVEVEVENKITWRVRVTMGGLLMLPTLNSKTKEPIPEVKKLVLARYLDPPGTVGVVSVNKGP